MLALQTSQTVIFCGHRVPGWSKVAENGCGGIDLHTLRSGCCGMAGLYAHEKANRAASEAIYDMSWANAVSDPAYTGRLAATDCSCRCLFACACLARGVSGGATTPSSAVYLDRCAAALLSGLNGHSAFAAGAAVSAVSEVVSSASASSGNASPHLAMASKTSRSSAPRGVSS